MDAIEWPDEADLALLGPTPEDGFSTTVGIGAQERIRFADALRKRLLKMHLLTGDLHIGQNLREVAVILVRCLDNLMTSDDAARRLEETDTRRELDDMLSVVLERMEVRHCPALTCISRPCLARAATALQPTCARRLVFMLNPY